MGGHADEKVRLAAARAIGITATRGDALAIQVALDFLQSQDGAVRKTALKALGNLVDKGDTNTMSIILGHLEDEDFRVREMATRSLKAIMDGPSPMVKTARGYMLRSQIRAEGEARKSKKLEQVRKSRPCML